MSSSTETQKHPSGMAGFWPKKTDQVFPFAVTEQAAVGGAKLLVSTLRCSKSARAMRIAVAADSFGELHAASLAADVVWGGSAAASGGALRASTAMIVAQRCMCGLTVKLRGRLRRQAALRSNEAHRAPPKRPERRRGRTLSPAPATPNKKPITAPSNDC